MRTDSSPSRTSSSEMPDCSTRSISVLILRKSIAPSLGMLFSVLRKTLMRSAQRKLVTQCATAGNHAQGDVRSIRMFAERLAGVHVRQMTFDEREGDSEHRVAPCEAGVRLGTGLDQDRAE